MATAQKLDVNSASREDMIEAGVRPNIADLIIGYREKVGEVTSIDSLKEIQGIGAANFEKIRETFETMTQATSSQVKESANRQAEVANAVAAESTANMQQFYEGTKRAQDDTMATLREAGAEYANTFASDGELATLINDWNRLTTEQLSHGVETLKALSTVRSVKEATELQSDFFRSSLARMAQANNLYMTMVAKTMTPVYAMVGRASKTKS